MRYSKEQLDRVGALEENHGIAVMLVLSGYTECALWANNLDDCVVEFKKSSMRRALDVVLSFLERCPTECEEYADILDWETVGHDLYLSSHGHGVSFGDKLTMTPENNELSEVLNRAADATETVYIYEVRGYCHIE